MPVSTKNDQLEVLNPCVSKEILQYIEKKIQNIISRQKNRKVYMLNEVVHTSAAEIPEDLNDSDPESSRKCPQYLRDLIQALCGASKYSFSIPKNWATVGKKNPMKNIPYIDISYMY